MSTQAMYTTSNLHYLSYRILLLLGAFCLVLWPQLELLLFLFKINQIPLIFQSSLPSLPKLQEKRNCNLEVLKYSFNRKANNFMNQVKLGSTLTPILQSIIYSYHVTHLFLMTIAFQS